MKKVNLCEGCKNYYPLNKVEKVEVVNKKKEVWLCKNCIAKIFYQDKKIKGVK